MWIVWLVVSCLAGWVVLAWSFIVVVSCYLKMQEGVKIPFVFRAPAWLAYVIGLPLDYAWAAIVGSIAFRERWRFEKFTTQCIRHKAKGLDDWRGQRAQWWCDAFEIFHEGHCH